MNDKYAKRQRYDKLVRDGIPAYLEAKGIQYKSHIADETEYHQKLWAKLDEEIEELQSEANAEELADVLEVLYAIADYVGSNPAELEKLRQQKAAERGGFKDRVILEES